MVVCSLLLLRTLELEEVFSLEREGEFDKFAPYREKLSNKMLLWHGSRLTNFVGILSQGLRIAPPEAPAAGYMFGKGVYFADLISKSAQYCFTDRKNTVGLMLLSEVALGEVYELTKAKYIEKLPKGKHSTKGLGKKVPKKSDSVKWKDDVIVPCVKPVPSNVKESELMYNEYIVYNTAQDKSVESEIPTSWKYQELKCAGRGLASKEDHMTQACTIFDANSHYPVLGSDKHQGWPFLLWALVLTPPSFWLDFWLYIMMVTFALVASLTPYC
ncbi:hypothetical protein V6N13_146913 [Hibiscus sabdariffa]